MLFSKVTSILLSFGRVLFPIFTFIPKPKGSMNFDLLISEFTYLRFIAGPWLYYPSLLTIQLSNTFILPFLGLEPNAMDNCIPPMVFERNEADCKINFNQRGDIIIIGLVLIFSISISVFTKIFLTKQPPSNSLTPSTFFEKLEASIGLSFFLAKMDALSLKLMIFAILTFYTAHSSPSLLSLLIASLILLYYFLYAFLLIVFIRSLSSNIVIPAGSSDKLPLISSKVKVKSSVLNTYLKQLFKEYSVPTSKVYLYTPVVHLLRNLSVAFIIVVLTTMAVPQVGYLLCIHIAYIIYLHAGALYLSKVDTIHQTVSLVISLIFLLLKLYTFNSVFSQRTIQLYLGLPMLIILVLMPILTISHAVYSTLRSILAKDQLQHHHVETSHSSGSLRSSKIYPTQKSGHFSPLNYSLLQDLLSSIGSAGLPI
jgi:hypothetical protein